MMSMHCAGFRERESVSMRRHGFLSRQLSREAMDLITSASGDLSPSTARHAADVIASSRQPKARSATEMGLTCSICMEVFAYPVTLECGHTCCKPCLVQWLEPKPAASCSVVCPAGRCPIPYVVPKTNVAMQEVVKVHHSKRLQTKLDSMESRDKDPALQKRVDAVNRAGTRFHTPRPQPSRLRYAVFSGALFIIAIVLVSRPADSGVSFIAKAVQGASVTASGCAPGYEKIDNVCKYSGTSSRPQVVPSAPKDDDVKYFDNYPAWIADNTAYAWAMYTMPPRAVIFAVRFGDPKWANPLFPNIFDTTPDPLVELDAQRFAAGIRGMSASDFWSTFFFFPYAPYRKEAERHAVQSTLYSWAMSCFRWKLYMVDLGTILSFCIRACTGSLWSWCMDDIIKASFTGWITALGTFTSSSDTIFWLG